MSKTVVVWLITMNRDDVETYVSTIRKIEKKLNIYIDLKIVTWFRLFDSLIKAFREGNAPDLFALGTTWISTFSHLGYLEPVPKNIGFPKAISPWIEECSKYQGVVHAVPYYVSPLCMYTRPDYLEQSNITTDNLKDFNGLYRSCLQIDQHFKSLGNNEHMPFIFQIKVGVSTMHYFFSFLYETGWRFPALYSKSEFTFNTDEFYRIFQYMNSLLRISGNQPPEIHLNYNQLFDKFYMGLGTFYLDYSNGMVSEIMNVRLKGKKADRSLSILPLPKQNEDGKAYLGGSMLAVSSSSRHKELAWEIIRCLIDDEALEADTMLSGDLPALDTTFWKKHSDDPIIQMLFKEISNSITYPTHPLWRSTEELLADGIYRSFLCFNHYKENTTYSEVDKILCDTTKNIKKLLELTWEI